MKTRLIFVRHGDLEGEQKGILHTPDDQVSLSEEGKKQMTDMAQALKSSGSSVIVSSSERRTKDSARILSESLGIPAQEVQDLEGRKWGEFSGKSWEEVGKILSVLTLDERYEFLPPGGESWEEFEGRLLKSIRSIAENASGQTIVIVSHGSTIRVLLPVVFGVTREESLKMYPDYGTLSIAELVDGKFVPIVFNSSSQN